MTLWQARTADVVIADAITVSTSDDFYTTVTSATNNDAIEGKATDVKFNEPESSTETIKFLGETSGHQNSVLDLKAAGEAEFTGTLALNPDKASALDLEKYRLTAESSAPTSYTRYNYASTYPSTGVSVLIRFNNGSTTSGEISEVSFLMNNSKIETLGGMKIDADGYATQEIKVKCVALDCWKEYKTNA